MSFLSQVFGYSHQRMGLKASSGKISNAWVALQNGFQSKEETKQIQQKNTKELAKTSSS